MTYEDLKELAISSAKNAWEQTQESSLYQQARDRFENLSPVLQKLSVFFAALLLILIFLSFPWGSFSNSASSVTQFEEKRSLIRDLLKVSRDANETPDIPAPPDMESLKMRAQNYLQTAQLLPEQIKSVEISAEHSALIPAVLTKGILNIKLEKLNIRQIVDIGYQLQTISPSVKMKDLIIEANQQSKLYFDVIYKLAALNVPEAPVNIPEPEEPSSKGRKGRSSSKPKSDSSSEVN